ncbi:MAG: DinB family protein [Longimonas sp.]|uniref:DinB family protein n=1 Tax=Longimonas sp. TaxID=2039626 RepID=UPI003346A94C
MPAALNDHLRKSLRGDFPAHASFEDATARWPRDLRGVRPDDLPYSGWELVEHVRLAQDDLLRYCTDEDYAPGEWPADYWPDAPAPPSPAAWTRSCESVVADREALLGFLDDTDPFETVPTHDTHTMARSVLIAISHTAYHIGQLVVVRRLLGCWPPEDTA